MNSCRPTIQPVERCSGLKDAKIKKPNVARNRSCRQLRSSSSVSTPRVDVGPKPNCCPLRSIGLLERPRLAGDAAHRRISRCSHRVSSWRQACSQDRRQHCAFCPDTAFCTRFLLLVPLLLRSIHADESGDTSSQGNIRFCFDLYLILLSLVPSTPLLILDRLRLLSGSRYS